MRALLVTCLRLLPGLCFALLSLMPAPLSASPVSLMNQPCLMAGLGTTDARTDKVHACCEDHTNGCTSLCISSAAQPAAANPLVVSVIAETSPRPSLANARYSSTSLPQPERPPRSV